MGLEMVCLILKTVSIHHKCYGNIISDPSRWTIPNYTEEKPSPSRKKSMICVDTNGYLIWNHVHLRGILGLDVYVMCPNMFSPIFSSSSWVWTGLPDPETINIHHKCYGNIISDPSRWTIRNYTEEKPSPSRKKSMICVDTNGYLIWNHFHLRGILGLDVYVMWLDMFSYAFLIFMGLTWFTTSWNHKYSPQILWEHHFRPIKMEPFPTIERRNHHHQERNQWYVCWYQWVFDLEPFPPSRYFGVGCVCNVTRYVFQCFPSSSWVWNGLPHPETINIHHKCYGNIISDPSRWTIPKL